MRQKKVEGKKKQARSINNTPNLLKINSLNPSTFRSFTRQLSLFSPHGQICLIRGIFTKIIYILFCSAGIRYWKIPLKKPFNTCFFSPLTCSV